MKTKTHLVSTTGFPGCVYSWGVIVVVVVVVVVIVFVVCVDASRGYMELSMGIIVCV